MPHRPHQDHLSLHSVPSRDTSLERFFLRIGNVLSSKMISLVDCFHFQQKTEISGEIRTVRALWKRDPSHGYSADLRTLVPDRKSSACSGWGWGHQGIVPAWTQSPRTKEREGLLNRRSKVLLSDFPGGAVVKNPPANAGDTGSSLGPERSHVPRSN